jgi:NADH dehydrogenase
VRAAEDAGVDRFFFLSHLGADRASAFPVLKAKAIAEEFIRRSKLDYTILRSAIVFGPDDEFTNGLARIMGVMPFILMPGDGRVLLQPLWVEDLVTCLTWSLDEPTTRKSTFDIGGPEYLSFRQIVNLITEETGIRRLLVGVYPPYLRIGTILLESLFPNLPVSVYWLDYMAVNRTTAINTVPRIFKLMPAKMSQRLAYLRDVDWRSSLIQALMAHRR